MTSQPCNGKSFVQTQKKVWTSQWSVILRTFYKQILSLLYSSFFFWNFRHRLARELLVYYIYFESSSLTETTKNMVMCRKSPALKKQNDHDDIFFNEQSSNTSSWVFQADFTISCLDSLQRLLPALRTNGNSWDFESKKCDKDCGVMTEKAFCLGTAPSTKRVIEIFQNVQN